MKGFRFAFLLLLASSPAHAQSAIRPPCGAAAEPGYAAVGQPPAIRMLNANDLREHGWVAPACTGWPGTATSQLVLGVAGRFRFDGTLDDILRRMGMISRHPALQYWSTSAVGWRPVATDAFALASPNEKDRRGDFLPRELTQGSAHYYREDDSRLGWITFRVRVRERTADRIVIATDNSTQVSYPFLGLFSAAVANPGEIQSVTFLEKVSAGVWGVYILERVDGKANSLVSRLSKSLINHSIAHYRNLAGIKTDLMPPAAP